MGNNAGLGQPLPDRLQAILAALCQTLDVDRGFVALRRDDALVFPSGETRIAPGDHLLIVSMTDLSGKVSGFIES